jgi:FKBP-type peptidyl-prolyl cis-trans isomerase FkpA
MDYQIMLKKYRFLWVTAGLCLSVVSINAQTRKTPVKKQPVTQKTQKKIPAGKPVPKPVVTTDFVKASNNLDYKWVILGSGKQAAAIGDFGEMHVIFKIGDTAMINTAEMNNNIPVSQQISAPGMKGDLMEGLVRMKAGDSAIFRMLVDTFAVRAHQPKPTWVKPGDYVTWEIKMVRVMTKTQMENEIAQKEKTQNTIDDALLQGYFKSNNIQNLKKTTSGLYYTVSKEGSGLHPKTGQEVTVNYTGQNLKGEKFDSNVEASFNHVEPFAFALGKHNVIKGWDEAVAIMNAGMKATFYIPSSLAYGERGQGPKIGPNEILIFDIELLSFK